MKIKKSEIVAIFPEEKRASKTFGNGVMCFTKIGGAAFLPTAALNALAFASLQEAHIVRLALDRKYGDRIDILTGDDAVRSIRALLSNP